MSWERDTSLLPVLALEADIVVILPPIELPILPTSVPHLSIMTQLTWPIYNFSRHNYAVWASSFELVLESHTLRHHLIDDPPLLRNPSCFLVTIRLSHYHLEAS